MADYGMTKVCAGCKRDMPLDQFARDKRKASGSGARCRECERARTAAINQTKRAANPASNTHAKRKVRPEDMIVASLPRDAVDLTNRAFGRLRALSYAGNKQKGRAAWNCLCDPELGGCGSYTVVMANSLRTGNTRSCGCFQKARMSVERVSPLPERPEDDGQRGAQLIDMMGQRIGMLSVVSRAPTRVIGQTRLTMWNCICDCGAACVRGGALLRKGGVVSCGCMKHKGAGLRGEAIRQRDAAYMKARRTSEPRFVLEARFRARVRQTLKRVGASKERRRSEILGYTFEDLEAHLTTTLPQGMTWDDFLAGRLEIDHVRELWRFDYKSEDNTAFREAWALSNLQFLTKQAHAAKSATSERERTGARRMERRFRKVA